MTALLGPDAPGLSASTVVRLKQVWQQDHEAWSKRSLADKRYVYWWVDGIYFNTTGPTTERAKLDECLDFYDEQRTHKGKICRGRTPQRRFENRASGG